MYQSWAILQALQGIQDGPSWRGVSVVGVILINGEG